MGESGSLVDSPFVFCDEPCGNGLDELLVGVFWCGV